MWKHNKGPIPLVGREAELASLDAAWNSPNRKNIVTIVAPGGVGKTSLAAYWAAARLAQPGMGGIEGYFDWSFHSQGTGREQNATGADKSESADLFIERCTRIFGDAAFAASNARPAAKGRAIGRNLHPMPRRTLLFLDGLESLQDAKTGERADEALRAPAARAGGMAEGALPHHYATARAPELDDDGTGNTTVAELQLGPLSKVAGAELLMTLGVKGTPSEREQLADDVKGHALTLTLLGKYLAQAHDGDIARRDLCICWSRG